MQVQNRMTVFTTTSARRRAIGAVFLTLTWCTPAFSQAPAPPLATAASLSGPRVGFTFLSDGIVGTAGRSERLVQGPIDRWGHCAFTSSETDSAFADLVRWVKSGRRPRP